ncbi:MAG TPA: helix-turn-helix transcriptional regulator [Pyrinomonadaceae bacterium]|nr:helix-turn-helix transcriptional regulator [Pyrinomonadaceae bacterium]
MIKNERQYRITKAQAKKFDDALSQLQRPANQGEMADIHPLLVQAQVDALKSQAEELNEQIREYESLRSGERKVLEVHSFSELPTALIQARIAAQLSQKELGARLGLKEQQIQNYESTKYASASLDRITQVVQALGIAVREEVFLPKTELSISRLFRRLHDTGLDRTFVVQRLLPPSLVARLELEGRETSSGVVLQAASSVGRIFGWSTANLLAGDKTLDLNMAAIGGGRFKVPATTTEQRFNIYTVYAHILSLLTLDVTARLKPIPIPLEPDEVRSEILSEYGSITFENVLRYIWNHGIPVLPLRDVGAFHGACWRQEGRNVIVLKQTTTSIARWLFDLLHELWHTGEEPEASELSVVEESETAISRRDSDEEQAASQFAGDIVLEGRAEELVQLCLEQADSDVRLIKKILPRVAKTQNVSVASLANYMAFRLSMSGQNWWGAATNLQDRGEDPWRIAREVFFENTDLDVLNEFDRNLLQQALTDETLVST